MSKRKQNQSVSSPNPSLARRGKGRGPFIFAGIVVAIIVVFVGWQYIQKESGPKPLTRLTQFKHHGDLAFVSPAGDTVKTIQIEIVDDMNMIAAGLMYRKHLEDNQGMLFIMPNEEIQTFWMKNTPIPLDMIFATSDGEIATIHPRTTPYSLESVQSTVPTKYVLEVRGGFAEEYGILEGQRIEWTRLDSAGVTTP
jgi:uncharacterized membrane protein (UPF0127 family)